jgi:hypothetical protein
VFDSAAADSNQPKESRMNRKKDRASTPEESLHATLDAVAARPAPANGAARVTRAEPFGYIPRLDQYLFTVNAGTNRRAAEDDALCLLICARERLDEGIQDGLGANDCHLLGFALSAAIALLTAAGAAE